MDSGMHRGDCRSYILLLSGGRTFRYLHYQCFSFPAAQKFYFYPGARFDLGDHVDRVLRTGQRLIVDPGHNISGYDPCLIGGAAIENGYDQDTAFIQACRINDILRHNLRFDADPATDDVAEFNDLPHYSQGQIGRNGQADPLRTTAAGYNCCVDPDQFPPRGNQGSTRIARIDVCISLDKIFERRNAYPVTPFWH